MILTVFVKPNSRSNELTCDRAGTIRVKIQAQPAGGKANDQLIKFLSAFFDTPRQNIMIISGFKGRKKNVKIDIPDEEVVKKLNMLVKET